MHRTQLTEKKKEKTERLARSSVLSLSFFFSLWIDLWVQTKEAEIAEQYQ